MLLTFKANYRENTATRARPLEVVRSTKCPKNRTSGVFAPFPVRSFVLPSLSLHLTRSPTMNDGVNCINFPLQKTHSTRLSLSGLLLARRSNFAASRGCGLGRRKIRRKSGNDLKMVPSILCIANAPSFLSGKVKQRTQYRLRRSASVRPSLQESITSRRRRRRKKSVCVFETPARSGKK